MSSGVTPCLRPPSVIAQLWETGVRMPIRRASRATRLVPILMPTCAKTELSEWVSAFSSEETPKYSSAKLLTVNFSIECGTLSTSLCDGHEEVGEMPSAYARARMNGLIEEPGWRWPCVARLNGDAL